jgi:hypothetical protein
MLSVPLHAAIGVAVELLSGRLAGRELGEHVDADIK